MLLDQIAPLMALPTAPPTSRMVTGGSLDTQLCGHIEAAATNAHSDLSSDKRANRDAFLPIPNHQADAQKVYAGSKRDEVLIVAGDLNKQRYNDGSNSRRERERLSDVTGRGGANIVDDEKIAEEIGKDRQVKGHFFLSVSW